MEGDFWLLDTMVTSVESTRLCENWAGARPAGRAGRLGTRSGATPRSHELRLSRLDHADPADLGGSSLKDLLVHRLRISSAEADGAHRRPTTRTATSAHRRAAATAIGEHAAAQAEGRIGDEHIQIIYDP